MASTLPADGASAGRAFRQKAGSLPAGQCHADGREPNWKPKWLSRSSLRRGRVATCVNLVGAVGFEPANPSLVRRNTARNTPGSPGRLMHVTCENNAWRCPQVPGRVCTVVPASGSRSSLLTTRFKSELRPAVSGNGGVTVRRTGCCHAETSITGRGVHPPGGSRAGQVDHHDDCQSRHRYRNHPTGRPFHRRQECRCFRN